MKKKTKKKKVIPENIKNLRNTFQKQANDIAADVYTAEIKKEIPPTPLSSLYMPPIPEKEPPLVKKKDYDTILDCLAALSMASGFFLFGSLFHF